MKNAVVAMLILAAAVTLASTPDGTAVMKLRRQVETPAWSGRFQTTETVESWKIDKTAIIICDMWDQHWCGSATARVAELAPAIDQFVRRARQDGALIIHAPSETLDFYRDHPARLRAINAPVAPDLPKDIASGKWVLNAREFFARKPIDDADGGCDLPGFKQHIAWTRQIETIVIDPDRDALTDSGVETWNLLRQYRIENVMLVGVHTNMCVVGRPFGLRNLVSHGIHAVLVRDLTDGMYNPARRPRVDHFTGVDLFISHIEKFICPTVLSTDFTGQPPFRFQADQRTGQR